MSVHHIPSRYLTHSSCWRSKAAHEHRVLLEAPMPSPLSHSFSLMLLLSAPFSTAARAITPMELSVRQYKRRGWTDDMMEWRCAGSCEIPGPAGGVTVELPRDRRPLRHAEGVSPWRSRLRFLISCPVRALAGPGKCTFYRAGPRIAQQLGGRRAKHVAPMNLHALVCKAV